jgi:hypothetical protein
MLIALVLVCSLAVTPDLRDCTRDTAIDAVRVPAEFANPATCFMHGQAYLAQSQLGRDLPPSERVKVVCARAQTADGSAKRANVH